MAKVQPFGSELFAALRILQQRVPCLTASCISYCQHYGDWKRIPVAFLFFLWNACFLQQRLWQQIDVQATVQWTLHNVDRLWILSRKNSIKNSVSIFEIKVEGLSIYCEIQRIIPHPWNATLSQITQAAGAPDDQQSPVPVCTCLRENSTPEPQTHKHKFRGLSKNSP